MTLLNVLKVLYTFGVSVFSNYKLEVAAGLLDFFLLVYYDLWLKNHFAFWYIVVTLFVNAWLGYKYGSATTR